MSHTLEYSASLLASFRFRKSTMIGDGEPGRFMLVFVQQETKQFKPLGQDGGSLIAELSLAQAPSRSLRLPRAADPE